MGPEPEHRASIMGTDTLSMLKEQGFVFDKASLGMI